MLLSAMAVSLNSCYSEFDPHIDTTPVLCMNSTIIPGDSITLFLTRTWAWAEGWNPDLEVKEAEVRLLVNGEFQELLHPAIIYEDEGWIGAKPKQHACYHSDYRPKSGDIIRIEAYSSQYGDATAEVTVPKPVPVERLEVQVTDFKVYGDMSGFPAVLDRCEFDLDFKLKAYFTDPAEAVNYYEVKVGRTGYSDYGDEAKAYMMYTWPDFSGEPLLTEHVSELESIIADTSGYTIFSDRQINGRTYPLRVGINDCRFYYQNPKNLPGPKEYGMAVYLRHLDPSYYRHVLSVWEGNDGITGVLGGIGLASAVYPYSNVSTGAGVVTAYAQSSMAIPMVDIIALAQQGNFQ